MPEGEFSTLVSKVKAESFADNKMRVVRTAAKNYNFSCNQIISLIDCFDFSDNKLEVLRTTYPKVTDAQNNFKILDAFTYSDDKETAESIMN